MDKGNADLIFGIPKDILSYYFGHFLRDIFNLYGITADIIGDKIGITRQTISNICKRSIDLPIYYTISIAYILMNDYNIKINLDKEKNLILYGLSNKYGSFVTTKITKDKIFFEGEI